jgi:outer membrane protein OmpA-like peptidoglycan-associated protein
MWPLQAVQLCPGSRIAGSTLLLLAALSLSGCGTAPTASPGPVQSPAIPAGRGLDSERAWLQSWFSGTPVVIAQVASGGPLTVEVPLEFCFEPGRSTIKPALAAVLDKVAQSLRRSGAKLPLIAAAGDGPAAPALALERARKLRANLVGHGVPAAQLGSAETSATAAVQLRMTY